MGDGGAGLLTLREGNHWCVLGRTGRGKSYLVKRLMREWLRLGHAVVSWDVEDEMSQGGNANLTSELGPLRDRATVSEFLADPNRYLLRPDVSLALVPDKPGEENPEILARAFVSVCTWIRERAERGKAHGYKPLVFDVEEVGAWAHPDKPRVAVQAAIQKLTAIATRWRKRGMVLVMSAQIMPLVPRSARSQVSKWVVFQLQQRLDRHLLALETSPEEAERAKDLQVGQYLVFDVDAPESGGARPSRPKDRGGPKRRAAKTPRRRTPASGSKE